MKATSSRDSIVSYGSMEISGPDVRRFSNCETLDCPTYLFSFSFSRGVVQQPVSALKLIFDGVSLVIGKSTSRDDIVASSLSD